MTELRVSKKGRDLKDRTYTLQWPLRRERLKKKLALTQKMTNDVTVTSRKSDFFPLKKKLKKKLKRFLFFYDRVFFYLK